MPSTKDLLPVSTDSNTFAIVGAATAHECVDDPIGFPDELATYLTGSASAKVRCGFPKMSPAASIVSVTLHYRAWLGSALGGINWRPFVTLGGTQYNGSTQALSATITSYTNTWTTNPATGIAWTQGDLDVILAGVEDMGVAGGVSRNVTQFWLRISYNPYSEQQEVARQVGTRYLLEKMGDKEIITVPVDLQFADLDPMSLVDLSYHDVDGVDEDGAGVLPWQARLHEVVGRTIDLNTLTAKLALRDVRLRMLQLWDTGIARVGSGDDAQGVARIATAAGLRTFLRNSVAWAQDANGVVHRVGSNFEKLEALGTAIENPSENYAIRSSFKDGLTGWTPVGNVVLDTADLLFDPAESGNSCWFAGQAQPNTISGLKLWLKADAITGLVDGDPVSSWPDSSGNGYNASQSDSAKRPLYKVSIINGKPVVRFDGSNDFLETTGILNLLAPDGNSGTVFVVVRAASIGTNNADAWTNNTIWGDSTAFLGAHLRSVPNVTSYAWDTNEDEPTAKAVVVGTPFIHTWMHTGGATLYNGKDDTRTASMTSVAHGTTHATGIQSGFRLGVNVELAGRWLNGDIAEVIVYNRDLTESERIRVEGYLAAKYAITVTSGAIMSITQTMGNCQAQRPRFSVDHRDDALGAGGGLGYQLQRPADSRYWRDSDQTWQVAATTNPVTVRTSKYRDVGGHTIDFGSAPPIVGATLRLLSLSAQDSIHLYHVQVNAQRWATSRILTQANPVTMAIETLRYANNAESPIWLGEGALFFDFVPMWDASDANNDGATSGLPTFFTMFFDANDYWTLFFDGVKEDTLSLYIEVGGSATTIDLPWTPVRLQKYRIWVRWTGTDGALGKASRTVSVAVDDVVSADVSLGAYPTVVYPSFLYVGGDNTTWSANGWMSDIILSRFPLTDLELRRLPI